MEQKSVAPALTRGLTILEIVAREGAIGFNELKEKMDLHATTVNRLIKVLMDKEYLAKDQNNKYTLGIKFLNLSNQETFWNKIIQKLHNSMKEINEKYGITVLLTSLDKDKATVIYKIIESSNLGMLEVGNTHYDLMNFPWGILYIAEQDKEKQEELIKKSYADPSRNMNVVDRKDIDKLIVEADIEKHVDDKGWFFNGRRFAVPIFLSNGKLIGALCSGSNKENLKDISIEDVINDMKKAVEGL
ncbi:helix-turn-helix domain-containing protein [Vallitalea guaymasensis]|uniref:Helix-turn-helix domain-containing protein n=1 Tax=Vallitalea guaymasensis TaxID=1185412 RepID=A0A8J8M7F1_9FIRM|nr:helix-turn-helix domain-containing protein [Vallitalea guaymasensis]QUH27603.1 helix-turn-helix domain-containing protein [Vallitalea guaymasensis]